MDYAKYLPHIDVNDGKARVMNNMGLYTTLLKKFKGRQMADELLAAIKTSDTETVTQVAHALRGTAGNLSLPKLQTVSSEIEALSKGGNDCSHLAEQLDSAIDDLMGCISDFTST